MLRRIIGSVLRIFFYLLYHGLAGCYDFVARIVSLGRWNDWVYSIIPHIDGFPVVELGHGPGHLQKRLLSSGRKIIGLDESRQMSALARKRLEGLPFRLVRADARRLPFPSRSIAAYVATFPSEYIFSPETLSELSRTLMEGGKAVILLASWPGGSTLLEKVIRLLFKVTGESPPETGDFSELSKLINDSGLNSQIFISNVGNSRLLFVNLNKF